MSRLPILLLLACGLAAGTAEAQIYRWKDENGRIHFSNRTPPPGVKAVVVDPYAKEMPPPALATEGRDCYTIRCQGERLEERERRREEMEARERALRAAAAPSEPRGLSFSRYISVQRGMSEGELLTVAGRPDHISYLGRGERLWTYLPTGADPFTTSIRLVSGRVSEIERVRRF